MNIEAFSKGLILQANDFGTSDVHILPQYENYEIYFRKNGQMERKYSLSFTEGERLILYFKYLANMDVGEKRRPQGGSLVYKIENGTNQDLRLSTITNYQGQESLVIRLLETQVEITLADSTFLQEELTIIKRLTQYKSGLIIFSGPVDSGKTTTMYQLIRKRMEGSKLQVISIEDPVEIREDQFFQIQVNERAGETYEESLKASLRHHPDIIIVGEIRDEETAKMVIRGALTGHLILATVHAKNAEGVLARMSELGISMELLKQTIIAIVFQKLLPIYCEMCEEDCRLYCPHRPVNQKRAALYDVLESTDIGRISLPEIQLFTHQRQRNFNHLLKKVYAYGFISKSTYEQYFIP